MQDKWNDRYPPVGDRPGDDQWPEWYQVEGEDLARFLRGSGIELGKVERVLDMGSGDGMRIIRAIEGNPALNRPGVHVTCVDFSPRAVMWGVDLWSRVRFDAPEERPVGRSIDAAWSMSFREEDAGALPRDVMEGRYDVVVDWMMMHGMPLWQVGGYVDAVMRMSPRYFVLKCFSREGSTVDELPESVPGVKKHQWGEESLVQLLGDRYEVFGEPVQCAEDKRPLHKDGMIGAKREYCFRLRGG